ncbi:MAG: hypothetical protein IJY11_03670 [Clostridia bacterium]|nr:hypothetical protein [Clostridia bacterium]
MKKSKNAFACLFNLFSLFSGLAFVAAVIFHAHMPQGWTLTFLLTSGTVFYHFAMRLFVGYVIETLFFRRLQADGRWFRERACEQKLYAFLRLKSWKGCLPTYNPKKFDIKQLTIEQLIQNTLQAEAVHETIALLSFLPIGFYFLTYDPIDLLVYILTSLFAAAFDTLFVLLQRFNRFRLLRLQKIERKKAE